MAIATASHGAPTAAASPRHIGKEKATSGVGAKAKAGGGSLNENFRCRPSDGGEQPFRSAFPREEFQLPLRTIPNKFVVPFSDAQNFVDGCDPFPGNFLFLHQGAENLAKRIAKASCSREQLVSGLRIAVGKGKELNTSFRRNDTRSLEKGDEAWPIGFRRIGEIDGKAATNKRRIEFGEAHNRRTIANRLCGANRNLQD